MFGLIVIILIIAIICFPPILFEIHERIKEGVWDRKRKTIGLSLLMLYAGVWLISSFVGTNIDMLIK